MGGAQPLAATMAGASCLAVEVDPTRIQRRLETRYVDARPRLARRGARLDRGREEDEGKPISIGLLANAADVYPELVRAASRPTS
jgi:urocanate hydratase